MTANEFIDLLRESTEVYSLDSRNEVSPDAIAEWIDSHDDVDVIVCGWDKADREGNWPDSDREGRTVYLLNPIINGLPDPLSQDAIVIG